MDIHHGRGQYEWEGAEIVDMNEYDTSRAKQRASVAWIVQKAHKNKVPNDLQDPYYRDYESIEHLKPAIVHRLANADLYCSALANIYSDPNFHNLSHWNIIQALARKGVYVAEPTDVALTETVLIQVTPIKMSAHLAVIEAMMALYIREVVVAERVAQVLHRVNTGDKEPSPQDQEEALVLWINHITQALQQRINQFHGQDQELPVFPRIQDLSDLSDGIGLAALIAFYCPQELPWAEIAVADPPSIADSLYNIGLVTKFCQESLPYNPCLLTKEDVVYMHSSVKQNVLAFVAELFFLLELEPVSCVSLPSTKKSSSKYIQLSSPGRGSTTDLARSPSSCGVSERSAPSYGTGVRRQHSLKELERPRRDSRVSVHDGMKPAGAPSVPSVRRSHSMNLNDMSDIRSRIEQRTENNAPSSYNSDYGGRDSSMSDGQDGGEFVVQRSRGLATLSDMIRNHSPRQNNFDVESQRSRQQSFDTESQYSHHTHAKERYNMDSKEEELEGRRLSRRGSFSSQQDLPAAGIPSRYDKKPEGRSRSRRNSISAEESQLTIENFGGSQDNLNYISRNPDKEPFVHTGRRESNYGRERSVERESPMRDSNLRPESRNSRERSIERRTDLHRTSMDGLDNRVVDKLEREALEREKNRDIKRYSSKEKLSIRENSRNNRKTSLEIESVMMDSDSGSDVSYERDKMSKATSFAELSKLKEVIPGGINIIYMQQGSEKDDSSKKNRNSEKKTTFAALPNQTTWKQQSVQSQSDDNRSVGDENMEPQVMASELHNVRLKLEEKRRRIESEKKKMEQAMTKQRQKLGKEAFMQAVVKGDVPSSVDNVSRKWLEGEGQQSEELRTPDMDNMDYDDYHKSLTQSDSNSQIGDSCSELELNSSRRSSLDLQPVQSQGKSSSSSSGANPPDPRTLGNRAMWYAQQQRSVHPRRSSIDMRRMSLYLEPGYYGSGGLPPVVPTAHKRASLALPPGYHLDSLPPLPSRMTDSLTEIQGDIHRLSQQQHQIQSLMHNGMNQQQNQMNQNQPGQFYLHDQGGSPVRRLWGQQAPGSSDGYASMSPATRRAQWGPARPMMAQEGYMMGGPQQPSGYYPGYPAPQPGQMGSHGPQHPQMGGAPGVPGGPHGGPHHPGFMLHSQTQSLPHPMYQNGQGFYSPEQQYRGYAPNAQTYPGPMQGDSGRQLGQQSFRLHEGPNDEMRGVGSTNNLQSSAGSSPSRQPPLSQVHPPQSTHSQSQPLTNFQHRKEKSPSPTRQSSAHHVPIAAPPPDDMEPQNVSFIDGDSPHPHTPGSDPSDKLKRLSISSGSRTYRITHEPGSPTRPSLGTKTFRVPTKKGTPVIDDVDLPQPTLQRRSLSPPYVPDDNHKDEQDDLDVSVEPLTEEKPDKGFYISFDDDVAPKRQKPQLRNKNMKRKGSAPTTPASTPSRDEVPVVPKRSGGSTNGHLGGQNGDSPPHHSSSLGLSNAITSPRGSMSGLSNAITSPRGSMSFNTPIDTTSPLANSSSALSSLTSMTSFRRSPSQTNGLSSPYASLSRDIQSQEDEEPEEDEIPIETMNTLVNNVRQSQPVSGTALVIGEDLVNENSALSAMEKKKEKLMMLSVKRKQEQDEARLKKELEAQEKREKEKQKEDDKLRKKEEEKARREAILERYKIKKAIEEAEKEGRHYEPPPGFVMDSPNKGGTVKMRSKPPGGSKQRPRTMHAGSFSGADTPDRGTPSSSGKRGSTQDIARESRTSDRSSPGGPSMRKSSGRWGSSQSLTRASGLRGSNSSLSGDYPSTTRTLDRRNSGKRPTSVIGYPSLPRDGDRKATLYGSRGSLDYRNEYPEDYQVHEVSRRPSLAVEQPGTPRLRRGSRTPGTARKYRSTGNLSGASEHESLVYHMSEDSGLGRATPPRRAPSPGMAGRHLPSPSGPGSLPPGLFSKRRPGAFDDNASDISSTASSTMDYYGPRLFKQPTSKSNRSIIQNAVSYAVFPGTVNQTAKHRVLEEINRSESKHFLILFRDSGCQFRAVYSYNPEMEEIFKLYGTGPKQVTDRMFEKFFKYNSGGKCFSQIHTKTLTQTIDAFTIHNSLWQGKKVNLPSKKDMKLVI